MHPDVVSGTCASQTAKFNKDIPVTQGVERAGDFLVEPLGGSKGFRAMACLVFEPTLHGFIS